MRVLVGDISRWAVSLVGNQVEKMRGFQRSLCGPTGYVVKPGLDAVSKKVLSEAPAAKIWTRPRAFGVIDGR